LYLGSFGTRACNRQSHASDTDHHRIGTDYILHRWQRNPDFQRRHGHTVYVVELGCTSAVSSPTVVTINPTPASPFITASGPTSFCQGDSVILTSNSSTGNLWSNGETTQAIVVSTGGSFTASVVALGCTSAVSNAILVIVNPQPAAPTISQNGNILTATPVANGYQWYFNGSIIPGATNQNYVATQTGDYTVVITDANGCTSSQSVIYVFTGLESELQRALTVSPNPNAGRFRLQVALPWITEVHISVMSIDGKTVYDRKVAAAGGAIDQEIDIHPAADGMYFLRLETEDEVVVVKLVKEE
jgi:hypothetical protein